MLHLLLNRKFLFHILTAVAPLEERAENQLPASLHKIHRKEIRALVHLERVLPLYPTVLVSTHKKKTGFPVFMKSLSRLQRPDSTGAFAFL
ncbi:hypothetical protein A1A1_13007 [Planococcus antarcticus DSM 14505]|uniref:Uncharacterized protein n=1 Tax=Planococcus antarcticus DSM 14505 TaxID=1185653 RepID=A0AA87LU81_9BACL|nr:hypothetical protein A1A1_13007 [Planococcus antarcticus DSM 14505]